MPDLNGNKILNLKGKDRIRREKDAKIERESEIEIRERDLGRGID